MRDIFEALDVEWLLYLCNYGYDDIRREMINVVYLVYMFGFNLDV